MSARLELVGEWRRRLADAEGSEHAATNRRWLCRMQIRLYRFLLSCYGKKDWRADQQSEAIGQRDLNYDFEPSGGKPLRPVEKMRVVLTAIAKAQDRPAQAGPLQRGLFANDWMVVASGDKIRAERYVELLANAGVGARIVQWGRVRAVEVQAGQFHEALGVLKQYAGRRGSTTQTFCGPVRIKRGGIGTAEKLLFLLVVQAPMVGLYTTAVVFFCQPAIDRFSVPPFEFDAPLVGPVALICGWTASVLVGGFRLLRPVVPSVKRR